MAVQLTPITLTNGVPQGVAIGRNITALRFINNTNAIVELRFSPNYSFFVNPNANALITGLLGFPGFTSWLVATPTFPASPVGTTANLTTFTGDEGGVWSTQSGPPQLRNAPYALPSETTLAINADDFGTAHDGVTDDTFAITNALEAAKANGGGMVQLGPYTYLITGTLIVRKFCGLVGHGAESTILLAGSPTADMIQTVNEGAYVARLSIQAPTTTYRTAGNGVLIQAQAFNQRVQDVDFENMFNAVTVGNGVNMPNTTFLLGVRIHNTSNFMLWLQSGQNVHLANIMGSNDVGVANVAGLINTGHNGVYSDNVVIVGAGVGISFQPTGTTLIQIGKFTNCLADTCTSRGWYFLAAAGATVEQIDLVNCWGCSTTTNDGFMIDSTGTVRDISLVDFHALANGRHGIFLNGGLGVDILAPRVAGNSAASINTNDGIRVAAGVSSFSISKGRIGSAFSGYGVSQNWGINVLAGASNNYTIEGNDVAGNNSGGISDNGTGATRRVANNPGYNPVGQVTAPAFPATTVATQNTTGADVTAYIANGTAAITVIQIAGQAGTFVTTGLQIAASGWGTVRIPAGGQIKFTYASGAPAWTWFSD